MATPDPAAYERVAQAAMKEAAILDQLGGQIGALGDRARQHIGGTATGQDRTMLDHTQQARTLLRQAAQQLGEGANLARKAAREAQEQAEAERRAAQQRQRR